MKDIQQLIKKDSQQGRYENIFPKTFLDAVIDKGSGLSLTEILSSFNMYFLSYDGSRESTRLQVPMSIRKQGLWVTYVMYDGATIVEYFDTDLIDDSSWSDGNNWRVGNNVLVGDVEISSEGNWVINGVDSKITARGEKGITPLLRVNDNKLEVSYTNGSTYVKVDNTPVFTQFRIYNNKLQQSTDLGKTWVNSSDYIAAWFRFIASTGENIGKIQISRDNGLTWSDLSSDFTNKMYIKGYRSSVATLPSSAVQGDIYGVGPTYDASDTNHTNPIYKLYVRDASGWVDNGSYNSISAGVVQTTGDSETEVMSQKAVSDELFRLDNIALSETGNNIPQGKNLFNKSSLAYGGLRYYISGITGNIIRQNDYNLFISHLIPLDYTKKNLTISCQSDIYFSSTTGYRFLDSAGNVIKFAPFDDTPVLTLDIPSEASYFQFSTSKKNEIQVEYGTLPTKYEDFITMDYINSNIKLYSKEGMSRGSFRGLNLFNRDSLSFSGEGYYISAITGLSTKDTGNYGYAISQIIDINASKGSLNISSDKTFSSTVGWRFLDKFGNIVSFGAYTNGVTSMNVSIPANVVAFQFTERNTSKVTMVKYGSARATQVLYSRNIDNMLLESNNLLSNVGGIKNVFIGSYGFVTSITPDLYDSYLFDPIPITAGKVYTVGVSGCKISDLTGGGFYGFYDSQLALVGATGKWGANNKTGKHYWTFTAPTGAKYLRFAISNFKGRNNQVFLYEGDWDSITKFQAFSSSPSSVDYQICKVNSPSFESKNLYDDSIQEVENRRYISGSTGQIVIQPLYDIFVSNLIPISYANKYLTLSSLDSFNKSTGWRFLNSDLELLDNGNMESDVKMTLAIPIGACYFQFSTTRKWRNIQVEYGKEATEYSKYNGIASTDYVDKAVKNIPTPSGKQAKVLLPDTMYFTKNRPATLYFNNFLNNSIWQNCPIQMIGTGVLSYNNIAAVCNVQSDASVTINKYDFLERELLKTVAFKSLNQATNSGKSLKVLCLGDSYTEIGYWIKSLKENLESDGVNLSLIGAMHSIRNGVNLGVSDENQTGGTLLNNFMKAVSGKCYVVNVTGVTNKDMPINYSNYVTYTSNGITWTVWGYSLDSSGNGKMRLYSSSTSAALPASGVLTKSGGVGDATINYSGVVEVNKNPFWNTSTNALDNEGINKYFTTWGFEKPDVLILQFMWNDLANWATDASVATFIANIKTFINLWKTNIPALKVVFSIEPSAPMNTGQNYDTNGRKSTVLKLAENLYSSFSESDGIYICPSFAFVDSLNGFGNNEVAINKRFPNYKLSVSSDSVHAVEAGMYQIGDAITPYLHKILLDT